MTHAIVPEPQEDVSSSGALLTPEQKELIRDSFVLVSAKPDELTDHFFKQLYQLDPTLQGALTIDTDEQKRMLISTLKIAVASLDKLELLVPILKLLAAQHKARGLTREQYDTFAEALIWSIQMVLLNQFTREMREAWAKLYTLMADVMMRSKFHHRDSKAFPASAN